MTGGFVDHAPVLRRRLGRLGRVTLNRPARLNALDLATIRGVADALGEMDADPGLEVVVLDGAGDRGFCAGGDLTVVHGSARTGDGAAARLWREEYALDLQVAGLATTVVALLDGIVMGGGLGLGIQADLRVVTERSVLAMPEVTIGLAPDVGAGEFLGRVPGGVGVHLATTGERIGPEEAVAHGLADALVPSAQLPALVEDLRTGSPARAVAARAVATRALPTPDWVAECYDRTDPALVRDRLAAHPAAAARHAAARIDAASPTAVAVTLETMLRARRDPGLRACLARDFRVCRRFLDHPDLLAGTGSVVARTGPPRWSPDRLAEVRPEDVQRFFSPLHDELYQEDG